MVCVPLCVCGGGGMSIRERNRDNMIVLNILYPHIVIFFNLLIFYFGLVYSK